MRAGLWVLQPLLRFCRDSLTASVCLSDGVPEFGDGHMHLLVDAVLDWPVLGILDYGYWRKGHCLPWALTREFELEC